MMIQALPTSDFRLLLTTYYLLPTTYYLLPTTYYLLPLMLQARARFASRRAAS